MRAPTTLLASNMQFTTPGSLRLSGARPTEANGRKSASSCKVREVLQTRAMVLDRYGEPEVMRLRDVPAPEPQDGELLLRVGYAGVNPSDSKARLGQSACAGYRYREVNFPFVTGMHAAGVVERTGSNVTEFRQGDRVITSSSADGKTWGSYAEFMRVSARNVSPMPKSLNCRRSGCDSHCFADRLSVSLPCRKGRHNPGPQGAHHGAAGGVGSFAVQFAKGGGLLVAVTCRTANVAYVRSRRSRRRTALPGV